ncbi:NAD(P)/FAD-dependent oxidoreductase [Kibdelosporangium aridum]|uniref:Dehydrogenase (Flavoprotein) n=1 Tax=Kibdelosporangium aridum TaxID=2030 RepID=A0A1Y5Y984_KIBAR|nr:NAD(P)/FAD-dependent oxidoreductase [Kibdelosporangium aridum]SMD26351.1 Dehydrogenase (flavoprotein) [Kibdelosporangium aridum]
MADSDKDVDILVIGGGPAGSTAAAMLARNGFNVLLLEREVFPRYHIGESLLASCLPTLRLSGAFDAVAEAGFTVKRGSVFRWEQDEWLLDWRRLVDQDAWSWQVDRATYDDILLRNATKQGATVTEGATVRNVIFDGDRPMAVEWTQQDERDVIRTTTFDFLVDASGRTGVLGKKHFDMRTPHELFQNVGIWGYWTGARLLPNSPEGAINVISSPDGWYWHIPLADDRWSVGLVTHKQRFTESRERFDTLDEYYLDMVHAPDSLRDLLKGAQFEGKVRAEQEYSYVSERFCGPGYILIGDAACFLDPLLSTGVHLAQYSAMVGAASIATILRDDMPEQEALAFFDYTYRRAYSRMLVLVSRMYRDYIGMDDYFGKSQLLVHDDGHSERPVQSFTRISTGLTDVREAADAEGRVSTAAIVEAAENAKDDAAKANLKYIGGIDMSPVWNIWRDPLGPDTAMGDIRITAEPWLGLYREATT